MKHIVLFSGGASSYVAAKRVLAAQPKGDVILLFNDTLSEDWDLYRFLLDAERKLDHAVTRNCEGRDIWRVFKDERMLGFSRVDPCSRILKRRQGDKFISQFTPDECVIYAGYQWTEGHRAEKFRAALAPYQCAFPLMERPLLDSCDIQAEVKADGIEIPRLYSMGFAHNNCGGFCIKAGISHFVHLYRVWPERYREFEAKEQEVRDHIGRQDVAVLRDRRGGESKPMTLRDLRERIEAGDESLPKYDFGGCGCYLGDAVEVDAEGGEA